MWWHTALIPTLGRQRQVDLCEFKDNLVYRESSRTAKDTQRNLVSKKNYSTGVGLNQLPRPEWA